MDIQVAKPRLLLAVLAFLIIGAATYTVVAIAGDDAPEVDPFTSQEFPTPLVLTPEQEEAAEAVIAEYQPLQELTGGQEWRVHMMDPRHFPWLSGDEPRPNAVTVWVEWDDAVDSTGPWLLLRCQFTEVKEVEAQWYDLRSVDITVDLASNSVLGFGVGGHAGMLGARLGEGESDRTRAELADCPPGLEDEEN